MTAAHRAAPPAAPGPDRAAGRVRAPRFRGLAWVAWRQQRLALAVLAVLAAGLTAWLVADGLELRPALAALARAHCLDLAASYSPACQPLVMRAAAHQGAGLVTLLGALPVVAAVFAGAPLMARGYESGSLRFAVTQGARRARWALPQYLVPAAAGVVLCVVPALAGSWLCSLTDASAVGGPGRWAPLRFVVTPLALPCWLLLGLSAGLLAGVALRRTVPAMAATGLGAAVVIFALARWLLLPRVLLPAGTRVTSLAPPSHEWAECGSRVCSLGNPAGQPYGAGVIVRAWFTHGGRVLTPAQTTALAARIPGRLIPLLHPAASPAALRDWLAARHYAYWISYQPGSRYWLLQGAQAVILLALAAALAGTAIWLLRRRPA